MVFLSTLSLRRATITDIDFRIIAKISIHALLAESDQQKSSDRKAYVNFYPRSPCGERLTGSESQKLILHFYPRSPCGERPRGSVSMPRYLKFLSTLSLRRATHSAGPWQAGYTDFYPRSPCGERLFQGPRFIRYRVDFYPRSPCGERPTICNGILPMSSFLSTLSLRRATPADLQIRVAPNISIHALLAESDPGPGWGRHSPAISIHALLAESDALGAVTSPAVSRFLSTLSLRRATTEAATTANEALHFYPRSPCGERHVTIPTP